MSLSDLPVLGSVSGASPKPAKGADSKKRRLARTRAGRQFREAVRQRDSYRCVRCNIPVMRTADHCHPRAAHVHHLRGRNVAPEDRFNPDAAVTLCSVCHRKEHHQ